MSMLQTAIQKTLTYFDMFDYPLTTLEVYRLLLQQKSTTTVSLGEVVHTLDNSSLKQKNGLYYFSQKEESIDTRHNRYVIAEEKMRKAQPIITMLSHLPFVRLIMASNSIAYNNTSESSDIDLVIVTKKGGVWWVRFFSLLLLTLLRMRPGYKNTKEKICISVFLDEEHLSLSDLRMNKEDIDFVYWVYHFYPVYDAGNYYERFWKENVSWVREYLPYAEKVVPHPRRYTRHRPLVRVVFEMVLLPFSKIIQRMQEMRFPKAIRELKNKDTRVQVQRGLLKFHVNDRREEHNSMFIERLNK